MNVACADAATGGMAPGIALVMIVKDEEKQLPRCLASVARIVDELVIVDTGSSDGTVEIARGEGARVIHKPWTGDFSAARNTGIAAANREWILVLDADEELDPHARRRMRQVLRQTRADALQVTVRNLAPPQEPIAFTDLRSTRLFRRRANYRYEGAIHEQVTPSILRAGGRVDAADLIVLHHGYESGLAQGDKDRASRNLASIETALAANPGDPYLRFQLGATLLALGDRSRARSALELADATSEHLPPASRATVRIKLAQIALADGDDPRALGYAQRALQDAPLDAVALQVAAVALIGVGAIPQGLAAFRTLIEHQAVTPAYRAELRHLVGLLASSEGR